jgi:hypothetical protein
VPETLEQEQRFAAPAPGAVVLSPVPPTTRRLARDDLRRQIAHLERELGELFASAFPRQGIDWGIGSVGGPRVLTIRDLERVRDALALRLRDARVELGRRADVEEANRGLLEDMITQPERHRWQLISNEDIGERGCRHWHSRPRWGILGMLFGWWRIRLSSGCPLAEGPRPPATAAKQAEPPRSADGEETPQAAASLRALSAARGALAPGAEAAQADRGGAPPGALGIVPSG